MLVLLHTARQRPHDVGPGRRPLLEGERTVVAVDMPGLRRSPRWTAASRSRPARLAARWSTPSRPLGIEQPARRRQLARRLGRAGARAGRRRAVGHGDRPAGPVAAPAGAQRATARGSRARRAARAAVLLRSDARRGPMRSADDRPSRAHPAPPRSSTSCAPTPTRRASRRPTPRCAPARSAAGRDHRPGDARLARARPARRAAARPAADVRNVALARLRAHADVGRPGGCGAVAAGGERGLRRSGSGWRCRPMPSHREAWRSRRRLMNCVG